MVIEFTRVNLSLILDMIDKVELFEIIRLFNDWCEKQSYPKDEDSFEMWLDFVGVPEHLGGL